jgi:hypothetical protein
MRQRMIKLIHHHKIKEMETEETLELVNLQAHQSHRNLKLSQQNPRLLQLLKPVIQKKLIITGTREKKQLRIYWKTSVLKIVVFKHFINNLSKLMKLTKLKIFSYQKKITSHKFQKNQAKRSSLTMI